MSNIRKANLLNTRENRNPVYYIVNWILVLPCVHWTHQRTRILFIEKYTQLQHAKHVLCMLLQAGKWYNYYLFFWCSHFWHACHEFLRIYLCSTTSFVCDIFYIICTHNPIISSFYFRQKNLFKIFTIRKWKTSKKKKVREI